MRCVVPAHWSRLNVIDGEAAVLGRDGLSRFRLNYPDGRNVALSKELPLIELSIIFGMALIWGLFCVIVPKSQDEPGPGTDDPTGVGPGAGAGGGTGTGGGEPVRTRRCAASRHPQTNCGCVRAVS